MIVQLSGILVEADLSHVVLDVGGVGYELGVSSATAAALPPVGEPATLLARLVVREGALAVYGFARREERTLFDALCRVSGVGPKRALSVLSTFSAAELARVAVAGDVKRMTSVPGVGKKLAGRLVLELQSAFSGDVELRGLLGVTTPDDAAAPAPAPAAPLEEATAALLSMGFTPEEAALALEGCEGAASVEDALSHALRRLGGGR